MDMAYNLVGLVVGLRAQVAEELDLRNEARTMDVFRQLFKDYGLDLLVVPDVHHDLTGRRVVTMEFLDGVAIDRFERVEGSGSDPQALVRELLRAWVLTGLRVAAFHADIHAGNLLLLRDGRLGMIDWGILARLDETTHRLFRWLVQAALGEADVWDDIAAHFIEVQGPSLYALGLSDDQIARFIRSSMEPVLTLPLRDVSMASLFASTDDVITRATGAASRQRSFRQRLALMRDAARAYRTAVEVGSFESPTMRMSFLATKQLIYLERYGRMYMPDESILGDHAFLQRALDESI
jgi:predicted unusual protein kinase regulating ubiquinone biosynthesis (AarF/ABC1/UbiB family)